MKTLKESFKRFKLNIFIKKLRKITINLEFVNIPSYINDLEILSYDFFNFPVRKESLEEILSDKVVAFGLRNFMEVLLLNIKQGSKET